MPPRSPTLSLPYIVKVSLLLAITMIVIIDIIAYNDFDDDDKDYYGAHHHHDYCRHHHHQDRKKRTPDGASGIEQARAGVFTGVKAALRRVQWLPGESHITNNNNQADLPKHNGTTTSAINRYTPGRRAARPINPKWINGDDNLSPEYGRLKRVACSLNNLSQVQTSLIEALIMTASDLAPSQNPVIQCNKERLKRHKDDIGAKTSKDWNVDKIKAQCQHPDRWMEFEHCILARLRNDDDYSTYQETLKKAVFILSSAQLATQTTIQNNGAAPDMDKNNPSGPKQRTITTTITSTPIRSSRS